MGDPIYSSFNLSQPTTDCLQAPKDPKQDTCKIQVEETSTPSSFTLERKNGNFTLASGDALRINKIFPNYQAPAQQISDYLLIRSDFYKLFGDKDHPTEFVNKLSMPNVVRPPAEVIDNLLSFISNFVSHGQLNPQLPGMKKLEQDVINVSTGVFVDPTLGTLVMRTLDSIKGNASYSAEARKRAAWLLVIHKVREQFWSSTKDLMDKSQVVADSMKWASLQMMVFLFANHILAEKGSTDWLFSQETKDKAKNVGEILAKVDPQYNASKNYYAIVASVMTQLKDADIPEEYRKDFLARVNYVESEYSKAGQEEMVRLLASQDPDKSFREYLKIQLGSTPLRSAALDIFLKQLTVRDVKGEPGVSFGVEKADQDLKAWIQSLPLSDQAAAKHEIQFLLETLFVKESKVDLFWNKQIQKKNNFYGSISLINKDRKTLDDLYLWSKGDSSSSAVKNPHDAPPFRGWTFGFEVGFGVAGFGAAAGMIPLDKSVPKYWAQGAAVVVGSSALGAATANLISHAAKMKKYTWLADGAGILVGGALGGLVYGLAVPYPKSGPPVVDPGTRYPTDPYGP